MIDGAFFYFTPIDADGGFLLVERGDIWIMSTNVSRNHQAKEVTKLNQSGIVDVANRGMLYVRYDKTNRHGFLNQLVNWGYTIREHLWDETEYTFPIITVDPMNKLAFGAGVTVMACYCSSGGREVEQTLALQWLKNHHAKTNKTPS